MRTGPVALPPRCAADYRRRVGRDRDRVTSCEGGAWIVLRKGTTTGRREVRSATAAPSIGMDLYDFMASITPPHLKRIEIEFTPTSNVLSDHKRGYDSDSGVDNILRTADSTCSTCVLNAVSLLRRLHDTDRTILPPGTTRGADVLRRPFKSNAQFQTIWITVNTVDTGYIVHLRRNVDYVCTHLTRAITPMQQLQFFLRTLERVRTWKIRHTNTMLTMGADSAGHELDEN
ncbi:hypothetical protein F2P81_016871 [Scophthalmus maximus]|uniref:Uncharacterized protein n=1 Tax=Scophthalmus maximus TaxID=52904 RepID=A0A6A4SE86_SCOMX|nr:hypothetical protein F2P81_016871 [Scophthalmus maximus]